jgi:Flp pilus assembly protein TadG
VTAATSIRGLIRLLAGNRRGATIIEFAIVAPVMLMLMMGLGDLLYQVYAKSILNGAVQKAARDAAIQGGADETAAIDASVIAQVQGMAPKATYTSTRTSYTNFTDVAPEPFTDTNGNGVRDPGECYTDINGNKQWDADPGIAGQGGANDVTLYTMTVTYPRLFPVAGLLGWPSTATIIAQTLLKNQPYATQTVTTPVTICT